MHLYFFLRGIKQHLEIVKIFLQSQFFQWKRIDLKTNKEEIVSVQGALRPTIFGAYEYVFPEEALPDVLAMIGRNEGESMFEQKKIRHWGVRKLFGCQKIPKEDLEKAKKLRPRVIIRGTQRCLHDCVVPGVAYHIIGIKKDAREKWEEVGYEQEML